MVSQVNGTWGTAIEVPGTAALNTGGNAQIDSVSCASAGNCSAGGFYTDSSGHGQAFVVSEVNGKWGKAEEVPGTLQEAGSARCRARRRATAAQAANTWTAGRRLRGQRGQRQLGQGGAGARHSPPSTRRRDRRVSSRCRAPRRATAAPAATTPTAPAASRRSWSARSTASGARQGVPAPPTSTPAPTPAATRCRAPRRATAARAESTPTAPAPAGVRGQRGQRQMGQGQGSPRHRHPQHRRQCRGLLAVVRLGGQLQRGRQLHRQLPRHRRRSWSTR